MPSTNNVMEETPTQTSLPPSPDAFSRPRPRPQRSPEQAARIRVRNRRREYLQKNPGYFESVEHEFADPDLYDTVVRRFQTPAEREAEGRSRGWGKVLESSLMRSEARLERVASSLTGDAPPRTSSASRARKKSLSEMTSGDMAAAAAAASSSIAVDGGLVDSKPETKEEGRAAWEEFLRERFVMGDDEDFDYAKVDGNEELDEMEHRDREEEWFDEEDPEWADDTEDDEDGEDVMSDHRDGGAEKRRSKREKVLTGQTGVQDY